MLEQKVVSRTSLFFLCGINLKQNEASSAHAESAHRGVNSAKKYVTQVKQQRPESPMVTLTWYAYKYKVHKLHQRYILFPEQRYIYVHSHMCQVRVTIGDLGLCCTCVTYFQVLMNSRVC